jgi:hypothetical protein
VRNLTSALTTALAVAAAGCVYIPPATPRGDRIGAAAGYVTYTMLDGHSSGNAEVDQQIRADVQSQLATLGVVRAAPDEAEAVVVVHAATAAAHDRETFYQGWGGWRWRASGPPSHGWRESFTPGALVVDLFDARTKQLVWQGEAADAVRNDAQSAAHARAHAIARMFRHFPVQQAASATAGELPDSPATDAHPAARVITSSVPAVLVAIDGEPVFRDVPGTRLQRIANTQSIVLRDDSGTLYLRLRGAWLEAYGLQGPWTAAGLTAEGADAALRAASGVSIDDRTTAGGPPPEIYVVTAPTDLIVLDGEPDFAAVDGTRLLEARNTSACLFREPTDTEFYVNVPHGWFRAWTINGPWEQLAPADLPADLIGLASARESCLSSDAGAP